MLAREHLRAIVDIQLGYLAERLKDRKMTLTFTEKARNRVMDEGYDPTYGARPLKRTIQQRIENPLATELLAGAFADGDTIEVDADATASPSAKRTLRQKADRTRTDLHRSDAASGPGEGDQVFGDFVEGDDPLGAAPGDRLFGHAEDDAGLLVLRDRVRSGLPHV
jgi:hypothetical protein